MKRTAICSLVVLALVGVPSAVGGLFEDIYRGLGYVTTPSGYPIYSDSYGRRVNGNRSGRLRIVPDEIGQGYTLELDRTFGVDATGRAEVLDLGAFEMELSGAMTATLGYTNRGMLIGNGTAAASSLAYSVRSKTGAQDVELKGTLDMSSDLEINQLGFYTLTMDVANTDSELISNGVILDSSPTTNFNIGPIAVQGNIYIDALKAMMSGLGMDTTPLDPFTSGSPIDVILDSFQQDLETNLVAGVQIYDDGQYPPVPEDLLVSSSALLADTARTSGDGANTPNVMPEPGTLMLASLGGLLLVGWHRKR